MSSYYTLNRPGVVSRGRTQSPAPQRNYISSLPSYNLQIIPQPPTKYPPLTGQRGSTTPKISAYDQNKLPSAILTPPPRSTSVSNRFSSNSSKLISPDLLNRHLNYAEANSLKDVKGTKNENHVQIDQKSMRTSFSNQYLTIKNSNTSTSTASVTSTSSSSSQSVKNNNDAILSNKNSDYNGTKDEQINEISLLAHRGNVGLRNLGNTVNLS